MEAGNLIVVTDDEELLKKVELYTPENFPEPGEDDNIVFVSDEIGKLPENLEKFREKIIYIKFPEEIKAKIFGNFSFTAFLLSELAKKGFFSREDLSDISLNLPSERRRRSIEPEEESALIFMGITEEEPLEFLGILPYQFHGLYTYIYLVGWDNEEDIPVFYRYRVIKHFKSKKELQNYKKKLLKILTKLEKGEDLKTISEEIYARETEVEIFKVSFKEKENYCDCIHTKEKLAQTIIEPDEIIKTLQNEKEETKDDKDINIYFKAFDNFFRKKEIEKFIFPWQDKEEFILLWDKNIFEDETIFKIGLNKTFNEEFIKLLDSIVEKFTEILKNPKELNLKKLDSLNKDLNEIAKELIEEILYKSFLIIAYGEFCSKKQNFSQEQKESFIKYLTKWSFLILKIQKRKEEEENFVSLNTPIGEDKDPTTLEDFISNTSGEREQKIIDVKLSVEKILRNIKPQLENNFEKFKRTLLEAISGKENNKKLFTFICLTPYISLFFNNILLFLMIYQKKEEISEEQIPELAKLNCIFDGKLEKIDELRNKEVKNLIEKVFSGNHKRREILHQTDAQYRNALMKAVEKQEENINKLGQPLENIIEGFLNKYLTVDFINRWIEQNLYARGDNVFLLPFSYQELLNKFVEFFEEETKISLKFEKEKISKRETQRFRTRCSRVITEDLEEKLKNICNNIANLIINKISP